MTKNQLRAGRMYSEVVPESRNFDHSGRIRKTCDDLVRNRLSTNRTWPVGVGSSPNAFLESAEREHVVFENSMANRKTAPAPLAHFALDDNLVIESAGRFEIDSDRDDGQPHDSVLSSHCGGRETGALEEATGAGIYNDQVLRIKDDSRGIALAPLDAQGSAVHQHGRPATLEVIGHCHSLLYCARAAACRSQFFPSNGSIFSFRGSGWRPRQFNC